MNTTLFFYLVHPLVALFASVGYAIVCNAPRKEIPYCGLTAFLCWLVYQLVLRHDGSSFLATLLATFAATGFARFLSYHRMLPTALKLAGAIGIGSVIILVLPQAWFSFFPRLKRKNS